MVTLTMTIVAPWGAWACSDHRLTAWPSLRVLTNYSTKHVTLQCPDGNILLTYTGLGLVGSVDVSQWIREVLRGESRTVGDSLTDLREQATATLGRAAAAAKVLHVFQMAVYVHHPDESRWAAAIANASVADESGRSTITSIFRLAAFPAEAPRRLVGGAGQRAIRPKDLALLDHITRHRPKRPLDYMRVLAGINERAAASGYPDSRTVSKSCTVVHMPPEGRETSSESFWPEGDRPRDYRPVSHLLLGIDLAESTAALFGRGSTKEAIEPRGRRPTPPVAG